MPLALWPRRPLPKPGDQAAVLPDHGQHLCMAGMRSTAVRRPTFTHASKTKPGLLRTGRVVSAIAFSCWQARRAYSRYVCLAENVNRPINDRTAPTTALGIKIMAKPARPSVRPGQRVPDSGIYQNPATGQRTTIVRNEPAPPTARPGQRWVQVVDTNPNTPKK